MKLAFEALFQSPLPFVFITSGEVNQEFVMWKMLCDILGGEGGNQEVNLNTELCSPFL